MKTYNFAVIGTGSAAQSFCDALNCADGCKLYAVCSRSADTGEAFASKYGSPSVYTSVGEMCDDENIDIVYDATPNNEHVNNAITAIEAGKAVLCEKPMAINYRQAKAMVSLAQEKGVFLMEGLWTSFLPVLERVKSWVDSGTIGEVRCVTVDYHTDKRGEDPQSRFMNPKLGGGALLDVGIYTLLCADSFLSGEPQIRHAYMSKTDTGVDLCGEAVLAYGDKTARVSFGLDYSFNHAIITGGDGYIDIPDYSCARSARVIKNGEIAEQFEIDECGGIKYEIAHVIDCLEKGKTQSPMCPVSASLRRIKLCDELRERCGVSLPADTEPVSIGKMSAAQPVQKKESICDYWYNESVFYHIYPLGMCGAPEHNDFSAPQNRINRVAELAEHIASMNFGAVYFGPVFQSSSHGYDTADYRVIDSRLGTNEQFAEVCGKLHALGVRIVLDGVFNHVGRDFWAFKDVREHGAQSAYKDWFNINFGGNSNYNDGFWYEGWEGHYELVKLNLGNSAVREHIFGCVRQWIEMFGIDGLRLDVAYCLDDNFLRELRSVCRSIRPDFLLLGEVIHGDYNHWLGGDMLDSVTNYECYKGIHSSINCANMHEIAYSLNRQFGSENWCLYRGKSLYSFVDNHDVSRIASILNDPTLVHLAYALIMAMPGIPSVYYGGELGFTGDKKDGDKSLRPEMSLNDVAAKGDTQLCSYIKTLAGIRESCAALCVGDYRQLYVNSKQLVFERSYNGERIICAVNTDSAEHVAHFNANAGRAHDLVTDRTVDFGGGLVIPAKSAIIAKVF